MAACACTSLKRASPFVRNGAAHAVGEIGFAARACPAPSPRLGSPLMRVCRPLLLSGKRTGMGAGGKDATSAAPCVRRTARNLPRAIWSDALKLMRPNQRRRLPFQANLLCFPAFLRDYTASPTNTALHRSWMLAERAFGQLASV